MSSLLSYYQEDLIEVGCDEVGRGCLAGPVVAAAVILPKDYTHSLLNDSKKVTERIRLILEEDIKKNALAYSVGIVSVLEIDEINVLNASFLAMHRAIDKLQSEVNGLGGVILIDDKGEASVSFNTPFMARAAGNESGVLFVEV